MRNGGPVDAPDVAFGQNDAGSGGDAGDNFSAALLITTGSYTGFLDGSDVDDYYKFYVASDQEISLTLTSPGGSDFDPYIYPPTDSINWIARSDAVTSPETTSFVADISGYWRAKINRYTGSGNYSFNVSVSAAATWSAPLTLDESGINKVAIAVDLSNNVYIMYRGFSGALRYTKWNGVSWSAPVILDTDNTNSLSIAVDSGGYVHIAYDGYAGELRYIKLAPDGSFTSPEIIITYGANKYIPQIAVDSSGVPHIICKLFGSGLLHMWKVSSAWAYDTIDASLTNYFKVGMVIDASNNIHVSYPSDNGHALSYRKRIGNVWQPVETVNASAYSYYSSLAIDTAGNPHIAYQRIFAYQILEYANKLSGSWTITPSIAPDSIKPSIVAGSAGVAHIVYFGAGSGYSVTDYLMYVTNNTSPIEVHGPNMGGEPTAIALDSTGRLHVAYANGTTLYYVKK